MTTSREVLAFFQSLGWPELVIIGIVALLLFGRRLPEVGRSLGKGIVEFKKGLRDTGDELKSSLPKESDIAGSITEEPKRAGETKQNGGFNSP